MLILRAVTAAASSVEVQTRRIFPRLVVLALLAGVTGLIACEDSPTEPKRDLTAVESVPNPLSAVTQKWGLAYVADADVHLVYVISTETGEVVTTIEGFSSPRDMVITPDGAFLYVANAPPLGPFR